MRESIFHNRFTCVAICTDRRGIRQYVCGRAATHVHEDKAYCTGHNPALADKRRERSRLSEQKRRRRDA